MNENVIENPQPAFLQISTKLFINFIDFRHPSLRGKSKCKWVKYENVE